MPEFDYSVRRWLAVAFAVAAAPWLCFVGVRHALASHYGASSHVADWERAVRVEPGNAENWYRLGREDQLDFDHEDLPTAISEYRRAVQLNPRSPYYKLDLASALETSGNEVEADKYFRAAHADYPISGEVSWRYGNFLLRQQRLPEAFAEIHRAVTVDPKLIPLAISRVWHSDPDATLLLNQVLPGTREGEWDALSFLAEAQETKAALTVWNRLIANKPEIDWKKLFEFTDMLVSHELYDEAGSVWRQANSVHGDSYSAQSGGSLIFDGGFEKDISGGGFGWQQTDVPGANFDFDTDEKHSGARSARVVFDGTQNMNYGELFQSVLVSPGTHYRFQAYLRADQISTDSGMRFEIFDPMDKKNLDVLTPNVIGTLPWTLQEIDFTTGPQTHVIRVALSRLSSQRLDNLLKGTVWVDDAAIFPAGSHS